MTLPQKIDHNIHENYFFNSIQRYIIIKKKFSKTQKSTSVKIKCHSHVDCFL